MSFFDTISRLGFYIWHEKDAKFESSSIEANEFPFKIYIAWYNVQINLTSFDLAENRTGSWKKREENKNKENVKTNSKKWLMDFRLPRRRTCVGRETEEAHERHTFSENNITNKKIFFFFLIFQNFRSLV